MLRDQKLYYSHQFELSTDCNYNNYNNIYNYVNRER